ncbi:hypothetical protein JNW88_16815 [Micromonospora sp. ATA32]|nr:hypothetical protein [Micromonospora sp. ATA32]
MNVRLIGGEMLVWSDLDGSHGPGPVRGSVLAPLLAATGGRVLIAGPHDPALVDLVSTTTSRCWSAGWPTPRPWPPGTPTGPAS